MKKYAILVIIVSIIAVFGFILISTYFQPLDSLMRPPQVEGENLSIQLAFEESVGKDYLLKQPISGSYRSAYTFIDLSGNKDNEVIVFYSNSSDLGIVRMNVLSKSDGKWSSIADFQSAHSDIQEIEFADLNGDGTKEIIVGWTVFGESYSKLIMIYHISDSNDKIIIEPVYGNYYSMFKVADVDSDGNEDILSLKYVTAGNVAEYNMSLLTYGDDGIVERGAFSLDNSISSVAAVNFDYLKSEKIRRIFIDGHKGDGGMTTDCFSWNETKNNFERYLVSGMNVSALSSRSSTVVCSDINADGIIEVPTEEFLPNISDISLTTNIARNGNLGQSLINWVAVNKSSVKNIERHIVMFQYGYSFKFDEKWLDNISVVNDTQKGILTFWSVKKYKDEFVKDKKLFSVMTITELDFETIGEISFLYSRIAQLKGKLYYSRIFDEGLEYGITKKEIRQRIIVG